MCFEGGADEGVGLAVEAVEREVAADKVDMESHVVDCDTKKDWKFDTFQLVPHRIHLLLAKSF